VTTKQRANPLIPIDKLETEGKQIKEEGVREERTEEIPRSERKRQARRKRQRSRRRQQSNRHTKEDRRQQTAVRELGGKRSGEREKS
jgi:hypothetical protein